MLALETGWTPRTIAGENDEGVTDSIRRAMHFGLYARTLGPLLQDARSVLATPLPSANAVGVQTWGQMNKLRIEAEQEAKDLTVKLELEDPEDDDDG